MRNVLVIPLEGIIGKTSFSIITKLLQDKQYAH